MQKEDYTIMEKYLNAALSDAEKADFELRLEREPQLAKELAWQKEMIGFLKEKSDQQQLKDQLKGIGTEYFSSEASPKKKTDSVLLSKRNWLIAASIGLLIAIAFLIRSQLTPASLYAQFAAHPPLSISEMSSSQLIDPAEAEAAFNRGDYASATEQLALLFQQNSSDTLLYLYLGISELEVENFSTAESIFNTIKNGSSDMADLAHWYLVLSAIKKEDQLNARRLLEGITPASEYYEQAQRLRNKIK